MTTPPSVSSVPWLDGDALLAVVEACPSAVTPLMIEKLFGHNGLEHVGDAPSKGTVRVAVWMPKDRDRLPNAATFSFLVYHSELVVLDRVIRALNMLRNLARARIAL